VVSPGLEGRRLRSKLRLRLVAKSGTLNVISEHLTWWNPLSFNNAIRNHIPASSVVDPNSFFSDSDPQIIFFRFGFLDLYFDPKFF
jgi:hypothetical protein